MSGEPCVTVSELCERLGGTFAGEGGAVLRSVGTLEQAGPDALSWVGDARSLPRAKTSKAGAILIPDGCSMPGRTVIFVADPEVALCTALELFAAPVDRVEPGVHATAVVSANAVVEDVAVGANVFVGSGAVVSPGTQLFPGVYIGAQTRIGRDCIFWPNVVVRERIEIGDRVIIHPNATIGADGFGYLQRDGRNLKIPQIGTVVIEDDVEIGAQSCIDRARCGVTRIRRGTKIDNLCQIAHNCDVGEHCAIAAYSGTAGTVTVGHHVFFGGRTGVTDHLNVGNHVQLAAGSLATKDIPDGVIVRGTPAQEIRSFRRSHAAYRKLPEWVQKVRDMAKRIDALERQVQENR